MSKILTELRGHQRRRKPDGGEISDGGQRGLAPRGPCHRGQRVLDRPISPPHHRQVEEVDAAARPIASTGSQGDIRCDVSGRAGRRSDRCEAGAEAGCGYCGRGPAASRRRALSRYRRLQAAPGMGSTRVFSDARSFPPRASPCRRATTRRDHRPAGQDREGLGSDAADVGSLSGRCALAREPLR